jgi:hypothetical protein
MNDDFQDDELLKLLAAEDPASRPEETQPESPGEREAVRARATQLLHGDSGRRRSIGIPVRPRLAVAAGLAGIALAVAVILVVGGSSSGPARALAIDKGPRWVTLTIRDPTASDAEMNQELAAAGIDRVRVRSVPGPQKGVGTWAGYADFGPVCEGRVTRFGDYGVRIPAAQSTPANRHSSDSLIDLTVPHNGALAAEQVGTPYSGATLRLKADEVDNPHYSAKILVPIRAKSPQDEPHANQIGASELLALGGVFAEYGKAFEDGHTACSDFGLKPVSRVAPPGQ